MFDVGFSELIVIGIVALVVFGPEDLPRVARMAGHLLGKFRRHVSDVKAEISREMELADIKRLHDEVQTSARSMQETVSEQVRSLEAEILSPTRALEPVEPFPAPAELLPEPPDHGSASASEPAPAVSSATAETSPRTVPDYAENQPDLFGMPEPRGPENKA